MTIIERNMSIVNLAKAEQIMQMTRLMLGKPVGPGDL